jgi:hypothetical protein
LIGKKIGVQAVNEPVWMAFRKANSLDPGKITKVPARHDETDRDRRHQDNDHGPESHARVTSDMSVIF